MRKVIARTAVRGSRDGVRGTLALLVIALGSLALVASPASAENVHVLTQTIKGPGAAALQNPDAVAVDSSTGPSAGDIYVGDRRNNRVVKFSSAGNFLLMWGKNVNEGTGNPNICTNVGPPTDICRESGTFAGGPESFGNVWNLAVDSSSGPSSGDVYVVDIGSSIQKFDPEGHLITSWGGTPFPGAISPPGGGYTPISVDAGGNLDVLGGGVLSKFAQDGSALGTVPLPKSSGNGVALDAAGNIFMIDNSATFGGNGVTEKVGSTGTDIGQVDTGTRSTYGLAYDPGPDNLFAIADSFSTGPAVESFHFNGSGEVVEADGSTCVLSASGCAPSELFGTEDIQVEGSTPEAVAVNTVNHKVYVTNSASNTINVYSQINVPKVTTGITSNLTRTSVKFNGHVDPDGAGQVSFCQFEYGTNTEYKSGTAQCEPGTTSAATDVSAELPAETLTAATTYHYRMVAGNANGNRPAKDMTFTTPPAVGDVVAAPASDVGRLVATFNGSFTGDGVDTSYHFEYGLTESYGLSTPVVDQGTETGGQALTASVHGLFAYSPYHYRLVAQNKYGKTVSPDRTFHTEAPELPSVESTFSSGVDQDSATLESTLDTGEGLTVYRFEYGLSEEYGSRTLQGGPIDPESTDHTASTELTGLASGETYHYRAVAINFTGTTFGPDETFTTPAMPVIGSSSATGVGTTSATLDSVLNPQLSQTTYHFEYGPTAGYGSSTPESAPIGPDDATHSVSAPLSGLAQGTTYHFRVVATNGVGTSFGDDQVFTTASPNVITPPPPIVCKKGFVKKHGKCVRKKKPTKHHKKDHRGGGSRRHG